MSRTSARTPFRLGTRRATPAPVAHSDAATSTARAARRTVAAALVLTSALGMTALSGCAAKPQDSNTQNGITPAPPFPEGVPSPSHYPLPGESIGGAVVSGAP